MSENGEPGLAEGISENDDKAGTTSCGRAADHDSSGHARNEADEDTENGSPEIRDGVDCETQEEQKEPGVLSALWIMFSTTQNASFFASVTLSGMGKGVIDTFLFVW